jgi:hypothetical protein
LNRIAGELRTARGRPVYMNDVIRELLDRRNPAKFIGSWKMSDDEEKRIFGEPREAWKKWEQAA